MYTNILIALLVLIVTAAFALPHFNILLNHVFYESTPLRAWFISQNPPSNKSFKFPEVKLDNQVPICDDLILFDALKAAEP